MGMSNLVANTLTGDWHVYRRDPSGNTITVFTGLDNPQGLLMDSGGNLYIESNGLFVLDTKGHLSQLTFLASLSRPVQGYILPGNIAMDSRGNIYRPSANTRFSPGKSLGAGPAAYDPSDDYSFYVYYQVGYQETITSITTVNGSPIASLGNYMPSPGESPAAVPFIYFDELSSRIPYAGPWSSSVTVTTSDGKQDNPIVYGAGEAAAFAIAPGTITPQALTVSGIGGTVADPTGDIYVSDPANNQVVKLAPGAATTTVVPFTGLNKPTQLAIDGAGSIYVLDSGSSRIVKVDAKGNQSVAFDLSAQTALTSLSAFTMDGATNLYLAGNSAGGQSAIYYLDTLGNQLLVAGNLTEPTALAVDFNEYVFSADTHGNLTRFGPAGDATQIATGLSQPTAIAIDPSDTVYVAGSANSGVTIVSPDGTETAYPTDALPADDLTNASAVAVIPDGSGSLAVGDSSGKQVFRIVRSNNSLGLAVAPVNDNFGDVAIGSSQTIGGFITNVGNVATPAFGATSAQPDFSWATDAQECVNADDGSGGNSPLAPAAGCGVKVTFAPTYAGTQTTPLNFFIPNTFDISLSVNATGNGVAATGIPTLAISPATATFPSTAQGTSSAGQVFTVTNSGTAPANISSVSIGGVDASSFTQTNNCGPTLAVNAVCAATVVFTPTAAGGTFHGTLSVASNDPKSPAMATLTGSSPAAAAPAATLSPSSLNFGSVTVGTTTTQNLTLASTGNAALTVENIAVTGANGSSFTEKANCGDSLVPGATCTLAITFDPAAAGTFTAAVTVQFSGGVAPLTSTLSGTGLAAAEVPAATLTPASLTFSGTDAGATSAAQTLTIASTGNAPLTISSIGITGANASSFADTTTCDTTLAAGATCTIAVTFDPATAGNFAAAVTAKFGGAVATLSSTLSGSGLTPTAPAAKLAPTSLTFTGVAAGTTSSPQVLTLSNPGTGALSITSIAVAGSNLGDFAQTNNCGASLAAGGSCTISVTFTPSSSGATESATISVQDNAFGSPQAATLSGTSPSAPPPGSSDFTITAQTPSQTINRTQQAQYTIVLAPAQTNEPFVSAITLAASGLPAGATATFTPPSVTPGATQVSTVMSVTLGSVARETNPSPIFPRLPSTITLAAMTFLLSIRRLRRARGALMGFMIAIVLAAGLASMTGCSDTRTGFATPVSTSTITVTGSSGTLQHATTVTLTVQ